MARISTHILDTSRGKPAAGINVELLKDGNLIGATKTNQDGRTDQPLLERVTIEPGEYTLRFQTGGFYPVITITFVVQNGDENYHVPLLMSPYGYSTYRGS